MFRCTALLLLAATAMAASLDERMSAIDAAFDREDPDAPRKRAEAYAALLPEAPQAAARAAQAWLDAGEPARALELAAPLAATADGGLTWVAAALTLESAGAKPAAEPAGLDARARARLLTGRAQRLLADKGDMAQATAHIDRALDLLKDAPPADRVPVYILRLLAMESAGAKPDAVQAWLRTRAGDPAAAEVEAAAITEDAKLVGSPAPALAGARVDGAGGAFDLAAFQAGPGKGRWVLVDFFASWCKPCATVAPAVARLSVARPEIALVGVSLDTKDTMGDLPAFLAAHGITWPVVADGLGWDGEINQAWRVTGIPALILVAPDGTIRANDLLEDGAEGLDARVAAAMQAPAK